MLCLYRMCSSDESKLNEGGLDEHGKQECEYASSHLVSRPSPFQSRLYFSSLLAHVPLDFDRHPNSSTQIPFSLIKLTSFIHSLHHFISKWRRTGRCFRVPIVC